VNSRPRSGSFCSIGSLASITPRRGQTILFRYNLVHKKELSDREFREAVSILVSVYKKAICTHPARGYFVARTVAGKNEAINYLGSVLTEVGDRRRALAEADPLERQERLFCSKCRKSVVVYCLVNGGNCIRAMDTRQLFEIVNRIFFTEDGHLKRFTFLEPFEIWRIDRQRAKDRRFRVRVCEKDLSVLVV
jgi:hypothetical protein